MVVNFVQEVHIYFVFSASTFDQAGVVFIRHESADEDPDGSRTAA